MQIMRINSIMGNSEQIVIRICGDSNGIEETDIEDLALEIREPYDPSDGPNSRILGIEVKVRCGEDGSVFVSFNRFFMEKDLMYRKLYVYVKKETIWHLLPGPCYGELAAGNAKWEYSFPYAHTKKGLQVRVLADALKLGIGHAALNVNLPCIVQATGENEAIVFRFEGNDYFFNRSYMQMLDHKVKALSDQNVVVNLIIINRAEWYGVWGDQILTPLFIHPGFHPDGIVSAFHVTSEAALSHYRACMEFLAERYMNPNQLYGRACGWIIGNEVNAPWIYCNCGEMEMSKFASEYQIALRSAFQAVRKYYAEARVYISLDHCWNLLLEANDRRFYRGRDLLETLHRNICQEGDFDWSIAYHPFPEDLSRADFWNDRTAQHTFDTGKITFKNIEILPAYMMQNRLRFSGRCRRIILSEQGLCSGHSPEEEQIQANAFVLAFQKIRQIAAIDSFIYHSHIDEQNEGLFLGLIADDGRKKPIYHNFLKIDGPEAQKLFVAACAWAGEQVLKEIFNTDMQEGFVWN